MINCILVAYDGNDDAENAIIEGSKLDYFFNAKIVILFVIEEVFFSEEYVKNKSAFEQIKRELVETIEDTVAIVIKKKLQYLKEKGLDANYIIEIGLHRNNPKNYQK